MRVQTLGLVEGGSRPYGQSELKIKKATSCEVAFDIIVLVAEDGIDSKSLEAFITPAERPALLASKPAVGTISRKGFSSIRTIRTENKKGHLLRGSLFILVADRTGLEPATSGVTGRHSNQLNYRSA